MALFYTDFLSLCCTDIQAEKQWWVATFDCKPAGVPADWDCPLPSDVALKLPGSDGPTILLSDKTEVQRAGNERRNDHPMVLCSNLKKAHEYLRGMGAAPGPIQEGGGTQFFEIRDPEGNVIEICKEP
jgi:catechol 2,3-dioxygenase-like lactoylglutathione lyase family enzyme